MRVSPLFSWKLAREDRNTSEPVKVFDKTNIRIERYKKSVQKFMINKQSNIIWRNYLAGILKQDKPKDFRKNIKWTLTKTLKSRYFLPVPFWSVFLTCYTKRELLLLKLSRHKIKVVEISALRKLPRSNIIANLKNSR